MKPHEIRADRSSKYGDVQHNMDSAGLITQGILRNYWQKEVPPIPGRIMALIMAGVKLSRSAHEGIHEPDTLFDAKVYCDIADDVDPRIKRSEIA